MKITQRAIRKVKNRNEYKIFLAMVKDNGISYSINEIVKGSRNQAKAKVAMHLRNHTQKAGVVELP